MSRSTERDETHFTHVSSLNVDLEYSLDSLDFARDFSHWIVHIDESIGWTVAA